MHYTGLVSALKLSETTAYADGAAADSQGEQSGSGESVTATTTSRDMASSLLADQRAPAAIVPQRCVC